ncbi:MAG: winged helix-turn-helix domain-containing protein [Ignavibacteria bacterium]
MLENILGSKNKERVLFYIEARNEGYAREIAKYYRVSLSPIQEQLDKLETGGIFVNKKAGKTIIYSFNPRFAFLKELKVLIEKAISFLPDDEKERLLIVRRRPRKKNKPL